MHRCLRQERSLWVSVSPDGERVCRTVSVAGKQVTPSSALVGLWARLQAKPL